MSWVKLSCCRYISPHESEVKEFWNASQTKAAFIHRESQSQHVSQSSTRLSQISSRTITVSNRKHRGHNVDTYILSFFFTKTMVYIWEMWLFNCTEYRIISWCVFVQVQCHLIHVCFGFNSPVRSLLTRREEAEGITWDYWQAADSSYLPNQISKNMQSL